MTSSIAEELGEHYAAISRTPLLSPQEERVLAEVVLAERRPGSAVRTAIVPVEVLRGLDLYPHIDVAARAARTYLRHALEASAADVRSALACARAARTLAREVERDRSPAALRLAERLHDAARAHPIAAVEICLRIERDPLLDGLRKSDAVLAFTDEVDRQAARIEQALAPDAGLVAMMARAQSLAVAHFIKANLRLVVRYARSRQRGGRVPLADLVQEGTLGLMKAIEKFDPLRGFKFSTYATFWIKTYVDRGAATQGALIPLPLHLVEVKPKVMRAFGLALSEDGMTPTAENIAARTGVDVTAVRAILTNEQVPVSLSEPLGDADDRTVADRIAGSDDADLSIEAERGELREAVRRVLATLDERERVMVELHFGIGGPRLDDDDIARRYGISRQRVSQVIDRVLRKLRHPSRASMIKEHVA